jgi:hypothetical protein
MAVSERESAGSGRLKFCLSLEARDHRGRNVRKRAHSSATRGTFEPTASAPTIFVAPFEPTLHNFYTFSTLI